MREVEGRFGKQKKNLGVPVDNKLARDSSVPWHQRRSTAPLTSLAKSVVNRSKEVIIAVYSALVRPYLEW